MKKLWPGDTLIEVLFAFAILSLVISVMFSGATSSYKSSLTAQDRTVALFLAQYQADGLKTYRDSLEWDEGGASTFTYLKGNTLNASDTNFVIVRNILATDNFCMELVQNNPDPNYWKINTNTGNCDTIAAQLAPTLIAPKIEISLNPVGASISDSQQATVRVSWQLKNSNTRENVTNTILLTKQR